MRNNSNSQHQGPRFIVRLNSLQQLGDGKYRLHCEMDENLGGGRTEAFRRNYAEHENIQELYKQVELNLRPFYIEHINYSIGEPYDSELKEYIESKWKS